MTTYSISRLAKQFGLSRTALLYYDSIGLLHPSGRTAANYRIYDESAYARLEMICQYRQAGLPLEEIAELIDSNHRTTALLEQRLRDLNEEIGRMRDQQRIVIELLGNREHLTTARALDKERWVAILRSTGLDDEGMHRWHAEFERMSPNAHQDFLESLGIDTKEIKRIRRWSKRDG